MQYVVVLLSLLLGACAGIGQGVRPLYVEDGKQIYEAQCNGTRNTLGDCKTQAYQTCGGRFKELSKDARDTAMVMNGTMYPVINRSIQFVCDN